MEAASTTIPLTDARPSTKATHWAARQPTSREILALVLLSGMIFVLFICFFQNYLTKIDDFGDSSAYMRIASAIRRWNFNGVVVLHFWGLPYVMAALSILTRISDRTSLLAICIVSSLASTLLACRLWGGWVAGFFAVINWDWMQRSFLGGSEPIFVTLLFAAFLAVRRKYWLTASLLAAMATLVRPLGVFALVGIGVTLLWRREFAKLALATTTGLVVGTLYAVPLVLYFGSPLANVHGYSPQGHLFGIPFYAIIKGTELYPSPWTNLIFTFGWIIFVLAGNIAMFAAADFREYARKFPVESIFAILYLFSVYCYNYPYWARGNFPRFVIPVIPFILIALCRWIPKDRRLLWSVTVISPLLAAASAIGIERVAATMRHLLS